MIGTCEIIDRPEEPVVSIRTRTTVTDLPMVLGEAYGQLMGHLAAAGQHPTGAPFVAYYNMDMQDLDIEVGFPVAGPVPPKGNVQPGKIPAGPAASCTFTGPYVEIGAAYEALNNFITAAHVVPGGTAYEFYLNDPANTPPAELQTLIQFPLQLG